MELNLEKYNFHWRKGFLYGFPQRRELYDTLVQRMEAKQVLSIIGLRRTGKTTLLKQLMDHLVQHGTKREDILFYSFDEEQPAIEEVLQQYAAKTGKDLLSRTERCYVFLDEVQKLPNWQNQVKYFYDHVPSVKFVLSGSASLFIRRQSQESLAGRIYEFRLHPLSFREFLHFSGKGALAENTGLFADTLRKEFLSYLPRQFIETIGKTEEEIAAYVKSIVEKVVYQDIPKLFPIEHEGLLIRILQMVASNPGMLSDYEGLSRELGLSRVTLSNYVFYLEESFLLKKVYNFSRNRLTSEKKMKKLYLAAPSFIMALHPSVAESKAVENLLITQKECRFFWRDPQHHEVDMVIEEGNGIIPVEIKWKETITAKERKGLLHFCKAFSCGAGMLVTKATSGEETVALRGHRVKLRSIPAWAYLLE